MHKDTKISDTAYLSVRFLKAITMGHYSGTNLADDTIGRARGAAASAARYGNNGGEQKVWRSCFLI